MSFTHQAILVFGTVAACALLAVAVLVKISRPVPRSELHEEVSVATANKSAAVGRPDIGALSAKRENLADRVPTAEAADDSVDGPSSVLGVPVDGPRIAELIRQEAQHLKLRPKPLRPPEFYLNLVGIAPTQDLMDELVEATADEARHLSQIGTSLNDAFALAVADKRRVGDMVPVGKTVVSTDLPARPAARSRVVSIASEGQNYVVTVYPGEFADFDDYTVQYELAVDLLLGKVQEFLYPLLDQ